MLTLLLIILSANVQAAWGGLSDVADPGYEGANQIVQNKPGGRALDDCLHSVLVKDKLARQEPTDKAINAGLPFLRKCTGNKILENTELLRERFEKIRQRYQTATTFECIEQQPRTWCCVARLDICEPTWFECTGICNPTLATPLKK